MKGMCPIAAGSTNRYSHFANQYGDFPNKTYISLCVCVYAVHVCVGQKTTCKEGLSPSTMWALGTKLRFPGLVADTLTC